MDAHDGAPPRDNNGCCSAPGPDIGAAPSQGWDKQSPWYVECMSPATASLAVSLLGHLGLFTGKGTLSDLKLLETHCGDARAIGMIGLDKIRLSDYHGCDFSPVMIDSAKERLLNTKDINRGVPLTLTECPSTALPYETSTFDRYMSNMGCCCVTDLTLKLSEAHRVLKQDGVAAMSMRLAEDAVGDTSFALIAEGLKPYGFPPGPTREGLHLGKDIAKLRARLIGAGFRSAVAWKSFVTLPIHTGEQFALWAIGQPPISKFMQKRAEMDVDASELKHKEMMQALAAVAERELNGEIGVIQIAVAVVVATK